MTLSLTLALALLALLTSLLSSGSAAPEARIRNVDEWKQRLVEVGLRSDFDQTIIDE